MKKEKVGGLTFDYSHVVSYDDLSTIFANNGIRFQQEAEEKRDEEPYEEKPLYKFAVFSDIHLEVDSDGDVETGNGRGIVDFVEALSACASQDVLFFCVAGDIGMNYGTLSSSTFNAYGRAITSAGIDVAQTPIYVCRGNHDVQPSDDEWRDATGCESNLYTFEENGDLFVFLSNRNTGANAREPYDETDLDTLQTMLEENPNRRVFLFMHFPLNSGMPYFQYAGLLDDRVHPQNQDQKIYLSIDGLSAGNESRKYHSSNYKNINSITRYGFSPTFNEDGSYDVDVFNRQCRRLVDMLKNRPGTSIVFSGHTHLIFDVDVYCPNVNFCRSGNMCTIHVPSLNYPRNADWYNVCNNSTLYEYQPVQGYIVEIYAGRAVVKGFDFNPRRPGFDYKRPLRQYVVD